MELPKRYDPQTEEKKWQEFWEEHNLYEFDPHQGGEAFTIDTPPPTVSGRMHIGHAFSYAQGDFIARFRRMYGDNVFYPFGTDDNGLPTERMVEKLKKVQSRKMSRQEFVDLCTQTLKEIKPDFIRSWKMLGISCDFNHSYSTIDDHSVATSQKSFIDLFHKDRVYKQDYPAMWCPKCQTAIAQADVDDIEMDSHFNDIIFHVDGRELVIATTRPEMLPACACIFVHPDDERYKDVVGKHATVPITGEQVPIIADEKADPEKGTGVVMCCTFGDQMDVEWWNKHHLPLKNIITPWGKMNENAGKYEGLSIKDARKQIIEDLENEKLLVTKKPITHAVKVHERCGKEIEFLKTSQWFIKVLDRKEELLEAGDEIHWYPQHMAVRYRHWVENLQWDWCISRQRHFGVPFPVWRCEECGAATVADEKDLPVDPLDTTPDGACECGATSWKPEQDVMDTWATSSVTPQIALNWAENKKDDHYKNLIFDEFYPMSLRLQAHDIIRTWAFYTITKGIYNNQAIPWKDIVISGHALDPKGKKMSKSKGNVVEPHEQIEKYSADALRFWAASSKLGDDLPFMEKELQTGKKTVTKLWNACKFAVMHLEGYDRQRPESLEPIDAWILSKLQTLIKEATEHFLQYEYSKTKQGTDLFFWHAFCDNYLEIVKDRLYNPEDRGEQAKISAQYTLYQVVSTILKLFAPIMPHITESIYQLYFAKLEDKVSLHISDWPRYDGDLHDSEQEMYGDLFVDILTEVRRQKSQRDLALNAPVKTLILAGPLADKMKPFEQDLKAVTGSETIDYGDDAAIAVNEELSLGLLFD